MEPGHNLWNELFVLRQQRLAHTRILVENHACLARMNHALQDVCGVICKYALNDPVRSVDSDPILEKILGLPLIQLPHIPPVARSEAHLGDVLMSQPATGRKIVVGSDNRV